MTMKRAEQEYRDCMGLLSYYDELGVFDKYSRSHFFGHNMVVQDLGKYIMYLRGGIPDIPEEEVSLYQEYFSLPIERKELLDFFHINELGKAELDVQIPGMLVVLCELINDKNVSKPFSKDIYRSMISRYTMLFYELGLYYIAYTNKGHKEALRMQAFNVAIYDFLENQVGIENLSYEDCLTEKSYESDKIQWLFTQYRKIDMLTHISTSAKLNIKGAMDKCRIAKMRKDYGNRFEIKNYHLALYGEYDKQLEIAYDILEVSRTGIRVEATGRELIEEFSECIVGATGGILLITSVEELVEEDIRKEIKEK